MTSAVVKAHPAIQVLASSLSFSSSSLDPNNTEVFWRGFDVYHEFSTAIVDHRGTAYSYVQTAGGRDGGFSLRTSIVVPGLSEQELFDFVQPLFDSLNAVGIPVTNSRPSQASNWGPGNRGVGDTPGSSQFSSRLFPRANFEPERNAALFAATQRAIRESVEAGYTFHGIHMAPTEEVAGYPGRSSAVNTAFRDTIMHADLFDSTALRGLSPGAFIEAHTRLDAQVDKWRAVSPESGAYFNEADVQEPNFQQAFFGSNYERLLRIKRDIDPWGLFYAAAAVGSEDWVVVTEDGLPTQNGPLCRASSTTAPGNF